MVAALFVVPFTFVPSAAAAHTIFPSVFTVNSYSLVSSIIYPLFPGSSVESTSKKRYVPCARSVTVIVPLASVFKIPLALVVGFVATSYFQLPSVVSFFTYFQPSSNFFCKTNSAPSKTLSSVPHFPCLVKITPPEAVLFLGNTFTS